MTMNIRKGNLLDSAVNGDISVIMHGCNCFHAMGAGIAGEIAKRFPEVPAKDREMNHGSPGNLTRWSVATVTEELIPKPRPLKWTDKPEETLVPLDNPFQCINLYTQYRPGNDFIASLFPQAITNVNAAYSGSTIGIPLIGCGIGGADWEEVMDTLLTEGSEVNWEVYVL